MVVHAGSDHRWIGRAMPSTERRTDQGFQICQRRAKP